MIKSLQSIADNSGNRSKRETTELLLGYIQSIYNIFINMDAALLLIQK
ncbi:Uncharacterised protein [Bacteroides pyogenes]|nr:Uncharacterised protein [Bacteroides pyogenes]